MNLCCPVRSEATSKPEGNRKEEKEEEVMEEMVKEVEEEKEGRCGAGTPPCASHVVPLA